MTISENNSKTLTETSDKGFIRKSGIFIFLTFMSSVFEIGFSGITSRLPHGGFGTFGALFNIFFIVITPLTGIQFVLGKEISSFVSGNMNGKAAVFAIKAMRYAFTFTIAVAAIGILFSGFIADFLRIDSVLPVILLMMVLVAYSAFPVLYGTIQGLKKFYILGFVHFGWGFFRFLFAAVVILAFSTDLNGFMFGVICAVMASTLSAYLPLRSFFSIKKEEIDRHEVTRALILVFPIIATIFFVTVLKNIDLVFAKRFFDPLTANAYRCAALVGSGFFTLSGIIMVMFPHVAEEKTQNRNPVVFLFKSFAVTIGLGGIGLLIAFFAPELVMRIITLGKVIPGSEPLIRIIGFVVLPVSLIYIMSNYLLAKHTTGFLPIIAGGVVLQILSVIFNHGTPFNMLLGIGAANIITLTSMLIYIFIDHRKYLNRI